MKQEKGFTQIPNDYIYADISDSMFRLIAYLLSHKDEFRHSVPSVSLFLKKDIRSSQRLVKEALKLGLIQPTTKQTVSHGFIPNYLFIRSNAERILKSQPTTKMSLVEPTTQPTTQPTTKMQTNNTKKEDYKQESTKVLSTYSGNAGGSSLVASEPADVLNDNKESRGIDLLPPPFNLSSPSPIKDISKETFDSYFNDACGVPENRVHEKPEPTMNDNKITPVPTFNPSIVAPLPSSPSSARVLHAQETLDNMGGMTAEEALEVDRKIKEIELKAMRGDKTKIGQSKQKPQTL